MLHLIKIQDNILTCLLMAWTVVDKKASRI